MSFTNLNTPELSNATKLQSIKVQGVTVYASPFVGRPDSPLFTIRTKSGRGLPKLFVKVSDLYHHYNDEWAQIDPKFCYVACCSILSEDDSVGKLEKTAKEFPDVLSCIFYGAAAASAGVGEQCSNRTKACTLFCLITSGKGSTPQVGFVRVARTRLQALNPELFWAMWDRDYAKMSRKAQRLHKRLACRPNGTTDRMPKQLQERIHANPDGIFYDYTAVPTRCEFEAQTANYHITLSRKETKANHHWIASTDARYNVALVTTPQLKAELLESDPEGELFVCADRHDLRIPEADGTGKLLLLAPKGRLRGKDTGFVCTTRDQVMAMAR